MKDFKSIAELKAYLNTLNYDVYRKWIDRQTVGEWQDKTDLFQLLDKMEENINENDDSIKKICIYHLWTEDIKHIQIETQHHLHRITFTTKERLQGKKRVCILN